MIAPAWGSNSNNGSKECAIHRLLPSNGPLTAIERRHAWDHSQKGASALHSTWSPLSLITQKCFGHLQIGLFWLAAHLLPTSTFPACTAAWWQKTPSLCPGAMELLWALYTCFSEEEFSRENQVTKVPRCLIADPVEIQRSEDTSAF